jgi:hypothetical protein
MLATETNHPPAGFAGIKRTKKPMQGPSKPGTDSSPEGKVTNASFDRSPYQKIGKSLLEGKLR